MTDWLDVQDRRMATLDQRVIELQQLVDALLGPDRPALERVLRRHLAETTWTRNPSHHFPADQLEQLHQERRVCQQILATPLS